MRFQSRNLVALFTLCLATGLSIPLAETETNSSPIVDGPKLESESLIPSLSLEDHLHLPIVRHKSRLPRTFALQVRHTVAVALVLDRSAGLLALQPAQLLQSAASIPMG